MKLSDEGKKFESAPLGTHLAQWRGKPDNLCFRITALFLPYYRISKMPNSPGGQATFTSHVEAFTRRFHGCPFGKGLCKRKALHTHFTFSPSLG